MVDWLLRQMPEMLARYQYLEALLEWLQEWIAEVKATNPAFPWILPSPLLMTSLEGAAQECKDVNMLRFVVEVQKQIAQLDRVNRQSENTALAMETLMKLNENVPNLEKRLKHELVRSGIMARLFFWVLLFLLLGVGVHAWIQVAKEFFGR
jgi:hypothetical protein